MRDQVVIFGEMLWDCLPSGPVAGGAPMNVALNLHQLGLNSRLISAVGKDEDGEKLLDFLREFELPLDLIQIKADHETSKVLVDTTDPENIKYNIISPVAWDFIEWTVTNDQAVEDADAFVFGTLGVRNTESLKTLIKLLQHPTLRIFDANLRPPFYDFEVIETLLGFTDVLKINEDELEIFADYFGTDPGIESLCNYLDQHFPMEIICITQGSKGALIYQKGEIYSHSGYKVQVVDSIGAGDAFLSGFIKTYLEEKSPQEILDFACKIGGFVATQKGGTPRYSEADIHRIGEF
ncbi:MAG: carbohydrate kinase [Algoriphagus sp.]|uniref:carbohydrate kinase family protein n=1 Tax=Algoriphagus sp. TaxID=1872435 RepID=UPI00271AD447|nr:carbohydrate kinase [Algoriphagus sp.]MDO8968850.1 carbohydrate kinase [Algoriphagus sp.]MDP2039677.1 carbohydrate kinase [Algoriphagus sp.]MDP3198413.1 carbohydrate kinase [Algoriphagus sp.]MDP3470587.1 carbohydrate kinase [Algoriphagus sp.]